MSEQKQVRCAIYTRKSSEEGLEQSFNSLDAQREACEAYVLSQKHEGWLALASRYEDGGFSGGSMERPGLKQLLIDIAAGRVQTVVVYKVDRLTRSLADFAKIVESFDSKGVSFVSVTQQFNTTTSMGRLTLNVLLSFAQFEREVTGERIRDKVAASKRKGMWMGGEVPLGYDLGNRELVVNEQEAEQVREIYRQYLRLKSVFDLQEYLETTGIRSKRRTALTGQVLGGCVLSRGTLYHLLSSPLYLGKIVHKGKVHDGLHQAIVPQELWDQVANQLSASRVERRRPRNLASNRLLAGLLFSESGTRYVPTHCSKQGRRYFYYIAEEPKAALGRLPAEVVERLVLGRLQQLLSDPMALGALFRELSVPDLRLLVAAGMHAAERLEGSGCEETRELLSSVLTRVQVAENKLCLEVLTSALLSKLLNKPTTVQCQPLTLECPLAVSQRGEHVKLVLEKQPSQAPSLRLTVVARARSWAEQIASGEITSLEELERSTKLSRRYVQPILHCAALSPERVEAVVKGDESGLPFWKSARGLALA